MLLLKNLPHLIQKILATTITSQKIALLSDDIVVDDGWMEHTINLFSINCQTT